MTVSALYDAVAPKYDSVVRATKYIGPSWLYQVLPSLPAPSRAVDFGCANGMLGRILRRHFSVVTLIGIDISEQMIKYAQAANVYDELLVRDLNSPFPEVATASIQLAVALGFSEFLDEPSLFLAETSRVLEPGGTLLISFQEHWPDKAALAPRSTRSGVVAHHAYSILEVEAFIRSHSLELESIESITGYVSGSGFACPYVVARAKKPHGASNAKSAQATGSGLAM